MLTQSHPGLPAKVSKFLGIFSLLWIVASDRADAIPSPELIVSSLSSLSQLWALAGAILGGGAIAMGAKPSCRNRSDWTANFTSNFMREHNV